MFQTDGPAIDHFKDVPGFKGLLKAILKHQIQVLVEQLSKHADEETIVLSASLIDGGLSHLGSLAAKDFLEEKEEIKIQFLRHCLTKHHRQENVPGLQGTVSAAVDITGYQDTSTRNHKEPAHYAHTTEHSNSNNEGIGYNRIYPPPRTKARKRSHPQQIKPVPNTPPPKVQYSQPEHGIDLTNHASKKPKLISSSQGTSSGNHVLSSNHPRSPQLQHQPVALVKIEPCINSDEASLDLSLNKHGIDLSTHSNSSPSHRRRSIEREKPHLPRTHSLSPPSIISLKDSVKNMHVKIEIDTDPEPEVTLPGLEMSGGSLPVEDVTKDHTSSRNESELSVESNTPNLPSLDTSDNSGLSLESLQNVEAPIDSANVGTHYAFQGVSMVDKYFSQNFDFRPPPQKKRVYRKVECDICHKMIYITNIKVHKSRHIRNNSSFS